MGITVVDTPAGVMRRIWLPSYSATKRSPFDASAMLTGLLSPTPAPVPSAVPGTPDPASVETFTPATKSTLSPTGGPGGV